MDSRQNEEILSEDPESLAVEADDIPQYDPDLDENAGVVSVEPPIISIGRARRKRELRQMRSETGDS